MSEAVGLAIRRLDVGCRVELLLAMVELGLGLDLQRVVGRSGLDLPVLVRGRFDSRKRTVSTDGSWSVGSVDAHPGSTRSGPGRQVHAGPCLSPPDSRGRHLGTAGIRRR